MSDRPPLMVTTQHEWVNPDGEYYKGPEGYRISVDDNDGGKVVSAIRDDLWFTRKADCEMAIAALYAAGLHTPEALVAAGIKKIREVACESLQW